MIPAKEKPARSCATLKLVATVRVKREPLKNVLCDSHGDDTWTLAEYAVTAKVSGLTWRLNAYLCAPCAGKLMRRSGK